MRHSALPNLFAVIIMGYRALLNGDCHRRRSYRAAYVAVCKSDWAMTAGRINGGGEVVGSVVRSEF